MDYWGWSGKVLSEDWQLWQRGEASFLLGRKAAPDLKLEPPV